MNDSKIRFIQCLSCGKRIPVEDSNNHTHTCQNKETKGATLSNKFQRWLNSLPPLPVHTSGCKCEICLGLKECLECKSETGRTNKYMYLDRKRRVWRCIRCHGYRVVYDPTQQSHDNEPAPNALMKYTERKDKQ